ncbi:hypothetical protein [uncultured Psychroserpens sp.]|uniref:hypothetical protein n=1 Tax=uncultured Psychroserpens sp. TaxID=255436 RepID=UPI0026198612|nr:hypothetical protein [uncultured Psychroserpens sp.]
MKNLLNIDGAQKLSKTEQESINGGGFDIIYQRCGPFGECPGDYFCKNGLCVDYHIL